RRGLSLPREHRLPALEQTGKLVPRRRARLKRTRLKNRPGPILRKGIEHQQLEGLGSGQIFSQPSRIAARLGVSADRIESRLAARDILAQVIEMTDQIPTLSIPVGERRNQVGEWAQVRQRLASVRLQHPL